MTARRILFVLLVFAIAAGAYAVWTVVKPYQGYSGEVFVQIPRGAGVLEISGRLRREGVLPAEWPFLLIRAVRPRSTLKAGEYRFDRPLSAWDVYRKMEAGDVFYFSLTIPEGYTRFEIAGAVAGTGLMGREEFLLAAEQGSRVSDLAPQASTLEGFLFPDTYRFTRPVTAEDLVGQMLRRFRSVYDELRARYPARAVDTYEIVTMASLVETETPVAAERPLVASVFRNRLRIGMPLQCDPTVVYALKLIGRYRGEIWKEDLSLRHPYNTYVNPGLPPGPIANPGRVSLEAAIAPAETDYLYFVADNKGGHVFSANLDRHAAAVADYRRGNARSTRQKKEQKTSRNVRQR